MKDTWYFVKEFLDSHSHESVIKGVLAHITEITDNEKLDIAYLNYLDNDEISSIINDELIQVIDDLEVGYNG
ncbi:hypothetical protein Q9Z25_001438 [Staphylococcus pseudintermedius]|uniref:Uncharacterized protein n=1 Tax=Staphylococcus pseudintermedius TaxID=283734 RepID=A0A8H9BZD4_STAPS|nr:hypothetical protein [Staphylococcus pseudintermedius]EGQ0319597.1 hypothetical protein [Staphylococcus pseudintermedius]EGQ0374056.1 hypothetical protein [Staphylococcus pseudintermedius]EGQ0380006.1 hypothetical protein [Staphylococcus pseudintermedius]EGQ0385021.1 hypothetical protein [Staphylococcus pseudintermedius]EGQ0389794.1 hypothetical protein [Staphylococcus pseudintermedius]